MHDFSALPPSHYDLEWAEATLDQAALYEHRAACGRHIRWAIIAAVLALVPALDDASMICTAGLIACGFYFARLAVRDQRRADAVFVRGVAAALVEGMSPHELSEAA